ncbi:hypothetical protein GCM10011581_16980 [Saccharopolyspora subtropica]|uniref:Uncharacterized protein n=1 Tax=Saccharopolyspora thermophila TaxID=89367 RepID=A0A917JPJ7_9PSEU|nr:hypothetical protein GCM10011581_16980 [Saccharopolyspora subtropica]
MSDYQSTVENPTGYWGWCRPRAPGGSEGPAPDPGAGAPTVGAGVGPAAGGVAHAALDWAGDCGVGLVDDCPAGGTDPVGSTEPDDVRGELVSLPVPV